MCSNSTRCESSQVGIVSPELSELQEGSTVSAPLLFDTWAVAV